MNVSWLVALVAATVVALLLRSGSGTTTNKEISEYVHVVPGACKDVASVKRELPEVRDRAAYVFLGEIGLEEYAEKFESKGYFCEFDLVHAELEDVETHVGVPFRSHARRIVAHAKTKQQNMNRKQQQTAVTMLLTESSPQAAHQIEDRRQQSERRSGGGGGGGGDDSSLGAAIAQGLGSAMHEVGDVIKVAVRSTISFVGWGILVAWLTVLWMATGIAVAIGALCYCHVNKKDAIDTVVYGLVMGWYNAKKRGWLEKLPEWVMEWINETGKKMMPIINRLVGSGGLSKSVEQRQQTSAPAA